MSRDVTEPSSDDLPWIIRINAQWFPIGLRIIVRCGLAGAPQDDALMLRDNGWHKTEAFALGTRKALIAAGNDYGWHRCYAQYHMTQMGLYMLYVGLEQAAYADARAMDNFLHETHTAFDPRSPSSVFG